MKNNISFTNGFLILALLTLIGSKALFAQTGVIIQQTPGGGIQPRLINDKEGKVHLLYFRHDNNFMPKEGDLYYRQYDQAINKWTAPVKVNTEAFKHNDAIGRANFDIDSKGRIHVVWFVIGEQTQNYYYTRSDIERTRFEQPQSLVDDDFTELDAGADITAYGESVAVVWAAGDLENEAGRAVFARISRDGGATFGEKQRVSNPDYGACACCALATDFIKNRKLAVAFRSAINGNGRHMQILTANLNKGIFTHRGDFYRKLHPLQTWDLSGCPVTTNDFGTDNKKNAWVVFETRGEIVQLKLKDNNSISAAGTSPTKSRQKNPSIAFNRMNEKLIAWGEAPGYISGGLLKMQMFDKDGRSKRMEAETAIPDNIKIPDYSFPAVSALKDGRFLVLY